jgi:hypothetical protein
MRKIVFLALILILVTFCLGKPGFASEKEKEFQRSPRWVNGTHRRGKGSAGEKIPGRKMGSL